MYIRRANACAINHVHVFDHFKVYMIQLMIVIFVSLVTCFLCIILQRTPALTDKCIGCRTREVGFSHSNSLCCQLHVAEHDDAIQTTCQRANLHVGTQRQLSYIDNIDSPVRSHLVMNTGEWAWYVEGWALLTSRDLTLKGRAAVKVMGSCTARGSCTKPVDGFVTASWMNSYSG